VTPPAPVEGWLRHAFAGGRLDFLFQPGPFDMQWWQWIAFPIVALIAWGVGFMLGAIVRRLLKRLTARTTTTWDDQITESLGPPLTLGLAILMFGVGNTLIRLTPTAFVFVGPLTRAVAVFTLFWALWRSARVFMAWALSRPWAINSASRRGLLSLAANIVRGIILGIGVLSVIAALGYPVGTALAGLGIGGLALAFGAQKTVENVFGSISLAVDQPFRIGDLVRVENFVGTVEEIGLRSTRFRTEERTLVTIPNGKLADQRLESLEARDRLRFATTLRLAYSTTREQLTEVLSGMEHVLRAHPRIWPGGVSVRLKELGPNSLDIEVNAWFRLLGGDEFLASREQILLEFMRVVEEAGTRFAYPTTTIHLMERQGDHGDQRATPSP
jgi:MscS family membrane protein